MLVRVNDGCGSFAYAPGKRALPGDVVEILDEYTPRTFRTEGEAGAAARYVAYLRGIYGPLAVKVLDAPVAPVVSQPEPRSEPSGLDLRSYPWRVRVEAARGLGGDVSKKKDADAFLREQDPTAARRALETASAD